MSSGLQFFTWGTPYRHIALEAWHVRPAAVKTISAGRSKIRGNIWDTVMADGNGWTDVLSQEELDELHKKTADLDPAYSAASRRFWSSRTENELSALAHQAWLTNDPDQYQMARSYLSAASETADIRP